MIVCLYTQTKASREMLLESPMMLGNYNKDAKMLDLTGCLHQDRQANQEAYKPPQIQAQNATPTRTHKHAKNSYSSTTPPGTRESNTAEIKTNPFYFVNNCALSSSGRAQKVSTDLFDEQLI